MNQFLKVGWKNLESANDRLKRNLIILNHYQNKSFLWNLKTHNESKITIDGKKNEI